MTTKDAIRQSLRTSQQVLTLLVSDLADADLLLRPVPGANTIAWQLGHLILSEQRFLGSLPGATPPELPAGFADRHTAATSREDPPQNALSKADYLKLYTATREATAAALDRVPEADLDRPSTGPVAAIAPTLGAMFLLMGSHGLLHAGQFSVVRRKLGKPNLF
jgi:uncharacterized damage-inducible protein DinB